MSNINERLLHENVTSYLSGSFWRCISATHKSYITNHDLNQFIENRNNSLDEKKFFGCFNGLIKGFDSIVVDLLVVKMFAYGFTKNAATFFHSYLKNWNQYVRTNNISSTFIWSFQTFNTWSTSFQYISKQFISLDYKSRSVKFCWW